MATGSSDGPRHTLSNIAIEKLTGAGDFQSWKFSIQNVLILENLWTCVVPTEGVEIDAINDQRALARINLSLHTSLYQYVRSAKTAKDAWKKLTDIFEDRGLFRRVLLLRQLHKMQFTHGTMSEYINEVMDLVHKLADIGRTIDDAEIAEILLSGLPMEYDTLVSNLETSCMNNELSSELVRTRLLQEELRKNGDNQHPEKAFAMVKPRKNIVCHHCGIKGHTRAKCFKLRREKKQNSAAKSFVTTENAFSVTHSDFIIDSGCSNNMLNSNKYLLDYKPSLSKVNLANSYKLCTQGVGKVKISLLNHCINAEALHVPDLSANLLSVSKLVKGGLSIVFDQKGCHLYQSDKCKIVGNKVGHADEVNGIYKLDNNIIMSCNNVLLPQGHSSDSLKSSDSAQVQRVQSAKLADVSACVWHKRLGHLGYSGLCSLRKENILMFQDDKQEIFECIACKEGKQVASAYPSGEAKRASQPLDLIHSDVCGPMSVRSWGGSRYLLTFTDDHTRKSWGYLLQEKSEVMSRFLDFKSLVEKQTGAKIRCLRSDGGGEYCNKRFSQFLKSQGIVHQVTVPYCPQQNGVSERLNRTIMEKARCMLQDSGLSREYWGEAVMTAIYLKNRCPTSALAGRVPEEVWTGSKVNLGHLRVFGCVAYTLIPSQKRSKLDPRSKLTVFVGYGETTKGYRLIDPQNPRQIIYSRNVSFLENKFLNDMKNISSEMMESNNCNNFNIDLNNLNKNSSCDLINNYDNLNSSVNCDNSNVSVNCDNLNISGNCDNSINNRSVTSDSCSEYCTGGEEAADDSESSSWSPNASVEESPPPVRGEVAISPGAQVPAPETICLRPVRSTRGRPPLRYEDYDVFMLSNDLEPSNYKYAMSSSNCEEWQLAMNKEYDALIQNKVWKLVDRPKDKNIVKCKWVYKVKRDVPNKDTFKARLVACGYSQQHGIDYNDTFSPVVRHSTMRMLFALATELDLDISHFDIQTAFLNSKLDEQIFMEQPPGFVSDNNKVCLLLKSIYGLKQASRMWNLKVQKLLCSNGYRQSKCEPCVYYASNPGNKLTIVALFVDDFYIFGNCSVTKDKLFNLLKQEFVVKDLGTLKNCLGIKVTRDKSKGYLSLDQSEYVKTLLSRFGMENCKPVATPMMLNEKFQTSLSSNECIDDDVYRYRELLGSLMYLAVCTRPDIAYVCSQLSQFSNNFGKCHWLAAKRVLRYLAGTLNYGLCFYKTRDLNLTAFTDADWANDTVDRKSYTGFVIKLGVNTINWESRKQRCVALSSTESEYLAISDVCKDLCFVKNFLIEILHNEPSIVVYNDNQSAHKLLEAKEYCHKRTKHIDLRYHFVKDLIQNGFAEVKYLCTQEMLADVLTKPLSSIKHNYFINSMNVKNVES